jgi:hypothetical protein
MVSIIQFNKIFLFLSFSKMRIGGIFDYVNYNLHQKKNFELPFLVSQKNKYLYEYEYNKMSGSKLISEVDVTEYLIIILGTVLLWIIALILPICRNSLKILKLSAFLKKISIKMFKSAGNSIILMLLVSMPLIFKAFQLAESIYVMIICFLAYLALLMFQSYPFYQARQFLLYKKKLENSLFHFLKSKRMYEENRHIIRMWFIDQTFLFCVIMSMYLLREYTDMMLIGSLLLVLAGIIVAIIKWKVVSRVVLFFKLVSQIGLFVFIILMMIQHYCTKLPVLVFDVIYVTSNLAKILEVLSFALWVFFKNRRTARQVHPVRLKSLKIIIDPNSDK